MRMLAVVAAGPPAPDPWAEGSSSTAAATKKLGKDVFQKEKINGIGIGDTATKLEAAFGKPDQTTDENEEAATGDVAKTMVYGKSEIFLGAMAE